MGVRELDHVGWFWLRGSVRDPAVALPPWTSKDTAALLLVLLLVPLLVGLPFARLGARDPTGDRLYRAYFTADFVWHTALVAELTKDAHPPRNPYLALEPIHYYWTYFTVPAEIVSATGLDIQEALKVNAAGAALLLVGAIFLAAWVAFPAWPFAVAAGVALAIVASSAEGLAATVDLVRRGRPLSDLRELNIDSITAWAFKGLRIDNLPRTMWYTPQHGTACALGLIAFTAAIAAGVRASLTAIALAGATLAAAVAFNPLLGGVFSAAYGAVIIVDGVGRRASALTILRHGIAALLVVGAIGWCLFNQMTEGAGAALHIGFVPPASNAPLITFLLSFGPLLLPIAIGLRPDPRTPLARVVPALIGVARGILLMFFVTLTVDIYWVGFRGGNIFFVFVPPLVARGFIILRSARHRWATTAVALAVVLFGLPTTVIDTFNAQDVENTAMGPGFLWTVRLTPDEQEALTWIRTHTPRDAVVQAEPIVRGRETWSLIPSFAERRMAAGLPISLMHVPDYDRRSAEVRRIYSIDDPAEAAQLAGALGINYLYVDRVERAAYPQVSKFDARPEYFRPVFKNAEATVYLVK